MASKKQKTSYASKLKEDPDLSSPLHDEIQMWAMKNKTALHSKLLSMTTSPKTTNDVFIGMCMVEKPIKNRLANGRLGNSIVGYMDVVLGNADAMECAANVRQFGPSFFIEIKSKITSFGEIMRELQFYSTHLCTTWVKKRHIVLLAPSIPFADMIREQGFTVLEYKADLFEV